MPRRRTLVLALPLLAAACAGGADLARNDQGTLQPQAVRGPCDVAKFFLLSQTAVHTTMTVDPAGPGAGASCSFVVLNPDLQAFPTASLITEPPAHGRAEAGFANGGRSPVVAYTPQPGYHGADRFTATIEPNDHAIAVAVTVR